ncbi:hypothetical protein [Flavobacterium sp. N1736]|uniref:hypothetical protein n=1 Tax=Flavobacterium sp. N1736 TaxID=2986823 RepID=UPI0022247290|nr:hypothetical protein [Flavobacterium sp. N1736]
MKKIKNTVSALSLKTHAQLDTFDHLKINKSDYSFDNMYCNNEVLREVILETENPSCETGMLMDMMESDEALWI